MPDAAPGEAASALDAPGDFFVRANLCVGPDGGHVTSGSALELQGCSGGDPQRIAVQAHPSGDKRLRVGGTLCIEVAGSAHSGAGLRLATCSTSAGQQFTVEDRGGGARRIHTANAAFCVDVPHDNVAANQALQLYGCNDSDAQKLEVFDDAVARTPVNANYSCLMAWDGACKRFTVLTRGTQSELRDGDECLDVAHADYHDGAAVIRHACNGQSNQKFRIDTTGAAQSIVAAGNSAYCVVPSSFDAAALKPCSASSTAQSWRSMYRVDQMQLVAGGRWCMGARGGASAAGTQLEARNCSAEAGQSFTFYTTPDRWSEIRSQQLCVDVAGGRFEPGTDVRLWSCNHSAAQRFQLEQLSPERQLLHTTDPTWCVSPGTSAGAEVNIQTCSGVTGIPLLGVRSAAWRRLYAGDGQCVDSNHVVPCGDALPMLHIERREGWHEVRTGSVCLGGSGTLASGGGVGWGDCGATRTKLERHTQPVGFDLRLADSNLCVDLPHNDASNALELYGCNDTEAQRWYDADRATEPPPPSNGPFTRTTWMYRQQIIEGNIPYVGSFVNLGSTVSRISTINFPTGWPQVMLLKAGHSTDQCNDPDAIVLPHGDMTNDEKVAVWGTSTLVVTSSTPLGFVGCLQSTPTLYDQVPVNITFTND